MELFLLRAYLLAGLIGHKALWEVMRRRQPGKDARARGPQPVRLKVVKAVKVAVLVGIVAQTMLPEVLPLAGNPFAARVAGTALFSLGLVAAILGRVQLGKNWSDIETANVKGNHDLVRTGIYQFVRHPIYAGDLLLLLGLELALNSWLAIAVLGVAVVVVRQTIREEKMLAKMLPGYVDYCGRTKRFIPFLV